MKQDNNLRGSEWRIWDLHVHSPASFHWNAGKCLSEMSDSEKEISMAEMFSAIEKSATAVFMVNDYWTFDGYLEFKKYIKTKNLILTKTVFPGMEIRVEAPTDYRLNVQIILSDELSVQQLKDFKSNLKIRTPNTPIQISEESIINFAKTLDDSKAAHHGYKSITTLNEKELFELGCKTIEITKESLSEAMKALPNGMGYIIMPFETSDGLKKLNWKKHPHADNYFMQSSHIFESRDDETIDLFNGVETPKNKSFFENFQKTLEYKHKPVISGSDAHRFLDYGKFPSGKVTWIKADPTWQGFKQVLIEPRSRVYVGLQPPKIKDIELKKRSYISSIKIEPTGSESSPWFNTEIPLNSGLVAIIGRKGTGKSALADIIALTGKTHIKPEHFSFLRENKFRKKGLAKKYQSTLTWEDGEAVTKNLDDDVNLLEPERVKYLPQFFVESICTDDGITNPFQSEINKVIFSYVPEETNLGSKNLEEFVAKKTASADDNIKNSRQVLADANKKIVALEIRAKDDNLQKLQNILSEKNKALATLKEPKKVEKPQKEILPADQQKLDTIDAELEKIEKDIKVSSENLRIVSNDINFIEKLEAKIQEIETKVDTLNSEFTSGAKALGIDLSELIKLDIQKTTLNKKKRTLEAEKKSLTQKLEKSDPNSTISLYTKKQKITEEKVLITKNLGAKGQKYQQYLKDFADYQNAQKAIIGNPEDSMLDTIKSIEKEITYIKKQLTSDLKKLYSIRSAITVKIFETIQSKVTFYEDIYKPLIDFIKTEKERQIKTGSILDFDVQIKFEKEFFTEDFCSLINHTKEGSFQKKDGAQKMLTSIFNKYDLKKKNDISSFTEDILEHLRIDKIKGISNIVERQLLNGDNSKENLYNLVFGLDYLDVRYTVLFNGKDLNENELSPGEKGALLLIFYLLIDKNTTPLIIDQPEENLDNESVFSLLVPYIRKVKKQRQVIIVTHNPNLAVVCDAEQVICTIKTKNNIAYETGSIENPGINKKLIDILEGTLPAFSMRDKKYIKF